MSRLRIVLLVGVVLMCLPTQSSAQRSQGNEVQIGITGSFGYDSNIFAVKTNPTESAMYTFGPSVKLEGSNRRLDYEVYWSSHFNGFIENSDRDRWSHDIRVEAGYDFSESTYFWARNTYRNLEAFGLESGQDQVAADASARDFVNDTNIGIAHRLGQHATLQMMAYYQIYEREDPRDFDGRYVGAALDVNWEARRDTTLGIAGNYSYNRLFAPVVNTVDPFPSTNTHVSNVVGKLVHNFTRSLQLKVEVGPSFVYEQADPDQCPGIDGPCVPNVPFHQIRSATDFGAARQVSTPGLQDSPTIPAPPAANPIRKRPLVLYSPQLADCETIQLQGSTYSLYWSCPSIFSDNALPTADQQEYGFVDPGLAYVLPSGIEVGGPLVDPLLNYQYAVLPQTGDRASGATVLYTYDSQLAGEVIPSIEYPLTPSDWTFDDFDVSLCGSSTPPGECSPAYANTLGIFQISNDLAYIGRQPQFAPELQISYVADISLTQQFEKWNSTLSYTRREEPDANAGGGTSVDHVGLRGRWNFHRLWSLSGRIGYRSRESTNQTPEQFVVAGYLATDEGSPVNADFDGKPILAQSFDDFRVKDLLDKGSARIPAAAGVVLGAESPRINVQNVTASLRLERRLTERSTASFWLSYRHQESRGAFYRTYDRVIATLSFDFNMDPIRF